MFTTLLLILLGALRFLLEVLLFIPRYILIECHDSRSAIWGTRAEAMVSFAFSSWGHDVVRRMDCLRCLTSGPNAPHRYEAVEQSVSFVSRTSSMTQRIAMADTTDESDESEEKEKVAEEASPTVVHHFSQWLHGSAPNFLLPRPAVKKDSKNDPNRGGHRNIDTNGADDAKEGDVNEEDEERVSAMVGEHALQDIFAHGIPLVDYSLLAGRSATGAYCCFLDLNQPIAVTATSETNTKNESSETTAVTNMSPPLMLCLPYATAATTPTSKGFIPPWYAVHAKAQLILALLDPLRRITTQLLAKTSLIRSSYDNSTSNDSISNACNSSCARYWVMAQKGWEQSWLPKEANKSTPQSTYSEGKSYVIRYASPKLESIPPFSPLLPQWPQQEVCHIPRVVKQKLQTHEFSTPSNKPLNSPHSYIPSLLPARSSMKQFPPTRRASLKRGDDASEGTSVRFFGDTKSDMCATAGPREGAEAGRSQSMFRVASVRWLNSPPPSSYCLPPSALSASSSSPFVDRVPPVVVLLLCPSFAQGGDQGFIVRRMSALCAALTAASAAKRCFYSNHNVACSCTSSFANCGNVSGGNKGRHGANAEKCAHDSSHPRWATWHCAIPFAEVTPWPTEMQEKPDSNLHDTKSGTDTASSPYVVNGETVPTSMTDVEHIVSHLRQRLRQVTVEETPCSCESTNTAGKAKGMETLPSNGQENAPPLPEFEPCGNENSTSAPPVTGLENPTAPRVVARNVYIIGVGWSHGSGPLLQYVISHAGSSHLDGLFCVNHTLSSNLELSPYKTALSSVTPATGANQTNGNHFNSGALMSKSRQQATMPREGSLGTYPMPLHRALLHERSGAVRLLFLAARLVLLADHLQSTRLRRSSSKHAQKQERDSNLGAALRVYLHRNVARVSGRIPLLTDVVPPSPPLTCDLLDTLARADAQVDHALDRWWIDSVADIPTQHSSPLRSQQAQQAHPHPHQHQPEKEWLRRESASNSSTAHSRRSPAVAPSPSHFGNTPGIASHPLLRGAIRVSEWDAVFSPPSCDDVSSVRYLAPSSVNASGNGNVTPHTAWELSSGNDATEPPEVSPGASIDGSFTDDVYDAQQRRPRGGEALRLFNMARGRLTSITHGLSSSVGSAAGDSGIRGISGNVGQRRTEGSSRSARVAMVALSYRSTQSAHLIARIRTPTLFLHAQDDSTAPMSSLPLQALATNPRVFTVLTRRGGQGVFLEGVTTIWKEPRLVLRERLKCKTSMEKEVAKKVKSEGNSQKSIKWTPSWWPQQGSKDTVKEMSNATPPKTATMTAIASTKAKKAMIEEKTVETVFVIEGTTWVERLLVEFVASAILSSPPRN